MSTSPLETVHFFDSRGALWVTCHIDDPEAVNFGPRVSAKPVSVLVNGGGTPYVEAKCLGLVDDTDEWSVLLYGSESLETGDDGVITITAAGKAKALRRRNPRTFQEVFFGGGDTAVRLWTLVERRSDALSAAIDNDAQGNPSADWWALADECNEIILDLGVALPDGWYVKAVD